MPKQENNGREPLKLTVLTPDGSPITETCDSVQFTVWDDEKRSRSGLYGVRPGHAPAILLLADGKLKAFREGNPSLELVCAEGFVRIEKNTVTVVTEAVRE